MSVVHLGPAAGWMVPRGIARWERELSFVRRVDMTARLGGALHATLPHEQIPPKKLPLSYKATEGSPFLPLQRKLVADAVKEGVRVFTVGVDRVSAGFFVFVEGGGTREPVRVQGNLVEMLAPTLTRTGTTDLSPLQDGLIDRLLAMFTNGVVSELDVELANALPRMARDGTGLDGTYLEVFEVQARALASRSARWAVPARNLVQILTLATRRREDTVEVPLFGEARREVLPPLEVQIAGKTVVLPELGRWTVKGPPNEELMGIKPAVSQRVPRPTPSPSPALTAKVAPKVAAKEAPKEETLAAKEAEAVESNAGAAAKEVVEPPGEPVSTPPRSTEPAEAPPRPAKRAPGVRAFLLLLLLAPLAYFVWDAVEGQPSSKEARPPVPTPQANAAQPSTTAPAPAALVPVEAASEAPSSTAAADGPLATEGGSDAANDGPADAPHPAIPATGSDAGSRCSE
jgi:hypothetical protein